MQEHLASHEPELYLELSVFNPDGKRVRHMRKKSESFLYNWISFMYNCFQGPVTQNFLDTGGVTRTLTPLSTRWLYMNNQGFTDSTSNFGIVVGTGITPVTLVDHKLATQILHGYGSGQFVHKAGFLHTTSTVTGLHSDLMLGRVFTNNSGATITVKETGIYVSTEEGSTPFRYTCIVRDLLLENIGFLLDPWRPPPYDPGTCDIGPNQSLLVVYLQRIRE